MQIVQIIQKCRLKINLDIEVFHDHVIAMMRPFTSVNIRLNGVFTNVFKDIMSNS